MGYDLLAAGMFVFLLPAVLLGFAASWALTHRERTHLEGEWSAYARKRRREYVPARGEWPNRSSPAVRWSVDDLRYELTSVGREAKARTRLVTWPRGRLLGHFETRLDGGPGVPRVRERPRGLSVRALDEAATRALLGFRQRDMVVLRYARGRLVLEWKGREANDARIDEAERVLALVAKNVEDAFLGRR